MVGTKSKQGRASIDRACFACSMACRLVSAAMLLPLPPLAPPCLDFRWLVGSLPSLLLGLYSPGLVSSLCFFSCCCPCCFCLVSFHLSIYPSMDHGACVHAWLSVDDCGVCSAALIMATMMVARRHTSLLGAGLLGAYDHGVRARRWARHYGHRAGCLFGSPRQPVPLLL